MLTSLDYLVIFFAALAAITLLTLCLLLFVKNRKFGRFMLYAASVLSLGLAYVGFDMGITGLFTAKIVMSGIIVLAVIAAIVIERADKGRNSLRAARALSALTVVAGFLNALI